MEIPQATHVAFSDAIEHGDANSVRSLLEQHPDLLNHPRWTPPPLHCAVLWDQPDIATMLLDIGADIEIRDPDHNTTPLRYAIVFGKTRLISLLASRGAELGPIVDGGTTAMQLARDAAAGAFDEFDDLPSRKEYQKVVSFLEQLGVE